MFFRPPWRGRRRTAQCRDSHYSSSLHQGPSAAASAPSHPQWSESSEGHIRKQTCMFQPHTFNHISISNFSSINKRIHFWESNGHELNSLHFCYLLNLASSPAITVCMLGSIKVMHINHSSHPHPLNSERSFDHNTDASSVNLCFSQKWNCSTLKCIGETNSNELVIVLFKIQQRIFPKIRVCQYFIYTMNASKKAVRIS